MSFVLFSEQRERVVKKIGYGHAHGHGCVVKASYQIDRIRDIDYFTVVELNME